MCVILFAIDLSRRVCVGMFALRNTCAEDTGDKELCTQKGQTTTDRVNSCGHVPHQHRVSARVSEHKKLNTWSQQLWSPWADNFERLRLVQSLNNKKPNRTGCQNGHDAVKEAMNSGVGSLSDFLCICFRQIRNPVMKMMQK